MTTASPVRPGSRSELEPAAQLSRLALPGTAVGPLYAAIEFLFLLVSPYLGSIAYHAIAVPTYSPPERLILTVGLLMAGLYLLLSYPRGSFALDAIKSVSVRGPLVRWATAFMCFTWASFALKIGDQFSRGGVMTGFLIGAAGIVALRFAAPFTVNIAHYYRLLGGRRTVFLSDGSSPSDWPILPRDLNSAGVSLQGWFRLPVASAGNDGNVAAFMSDVAAIVRERRVEEIVVIADAFRQAAVGPVLDALRVLPVRVLVLPTDAAAEKVERERPLAARAFEVQAPPLSRGEWVTKRCLDVALAGTLLVLLSPLLVAIAIMIRLDSKGPILFRQTRAGYCGRPFMIYKFRSMYTTENGPVIKQAEKGDRRVTRVGRLLREKSLDELPQLINVVLGDMSLVGPRPHAMAHDRYYEPLIPDYTWRYHALPGITGWAQVNGYRGETPTLESMEGRIQRDLWYIRNWSVWLDLRILALTVGAVIRPKNAY